MRTLATTLVGLVVAGAAFAQAPEFLDDGSWHWIDLTNGPSRMLPARSGDPIAGTQLYVITEGHFLAIRCSETEETFVTSDGRIIPRSLDYWLGVRHDIVPPDNWNGVMEVLFGLEGDRVTMQSAPSYAGGAFGFNINGGQLGAILNSSSDEIEIRFGDTEVSYRFPLQGLRDVFEHIQCQ